MKTSLRFLPYIALSILALLLAMWAGLIRIGWALPAFPNLAAAHGPLMVSGFLGVLIPLERAVAIRQKWMFLVPLVCGVGWISLFFAPSFGAMLLTLGSLGALGILGVMVKREPQIHTITMAAGVLAWFIGNILWLLGSPLYMVVFWWIAFLVLTIGGERLELNRILRPSRLQSLIFNLAAALLGLAVILTQVDQALGSRILGIALVFLSVWFLRNDLARRNLRHPNPLTKYIAVCLFGGFIWLGVSGLLFLYFGALYAGPLYDAALHAVFVGFVIAMIFGHAPIIFPAILGSQIKFYRIFYLHLGLLHASLVLRVVGDLANQMEWRRWGGLLGEVAILLFLGLTIYSVFQGRKSG